MQTDLSNFIHTIHLDLTTRVNLVQNLLKTKELPVGFKKKLNEFAALLSITRSNFHLVTVSKNTTCIDMRENSMVLKMP